MPAYHRQKPDMHITHMGSSSAASQRCSPGNVMQVVGMAAKWPIVEDGRRQVLAGLGEALLQEHPPYHAPVATGLPDHTSLSEFSLPTAELLLCGVLGKTARASDIAWRLCYWSMTSGVWRCGWVLAYQVFTLVLLLGLFPLVCIGQVPG